MSGCSGPAGITRVVEPHWSIREAGVWVLGKLFFQHIDLKSHQEHIHQSFFPFMIPREICQKSTGNNMTSCTHWDLRHPKLLHLLHPPPPTTPPPPPPPPQRVPTPNIPVLLLPWLHQLLQLLQLHWPKFKCQWICLSSLHLWCSPCHSSHYLSDFCPAASCGAQSSHWSGPASTNSQLTPCHVQQQNKRPSNPYHSMTS